MFTLKLCLKKVHSCAGFVQILFVSFFWLLDPSFISNSEMPEHQIPWQSQHYTRDPVSTKLSR